MLVRIVVEVVVVVVVVAVSADAYRFAASPPNTSSMFLSIFKKTPSSLFGQAQEQTHGHNQAPEDTTTATAATSKIVSDINNLLEANEQYRQLKAKIEAANMALEKIQRNIMEANTQIAQADEEFGPEIARIRKEFSRIKERSFQEGKEAATQAKVDALKDMLPVADNYARARQAFEPIGEGGNEDAIMSRYKNIFEQFENIIESFGIVRVSALGELFDVHFMEAIAALPSTQYPAQHVCQEFQVGYRVQEKCVRPALVAVSVGPGPG